MKTGGVTRKIDGLGRIVVPKSMCKALYIQENDELDVTMEGERIVLQKRQTGCVFCESTEGLLSYNGRKLCRACAEGLKHLNS